MAKGGKRPGAGRKRKTQVSLGNLPKNIAVEVMSDPRAQIKERLLSLLEYSQKADRRLEYALVTKIVERAEGLPSRMAGDENSTDPSFGLKVTVEYIGRHKDQTSAKARFAGGVVG